MRGIINLDERTIIGPNGECYEILGLIIFKDSEHIKGKKYEKIYDFDTSLCRACIYPGIETNFRVVDNIKGLAYIM